MTITTYLQIEAFPFLLLMLIFFLSLKQFPEVKSIGRFRMMVAFVMLELIIDVICWHGVSKPGNFSITLLWIINILYFAVTEILAFLWFIYIYIRINDDNLSERQNMFCKLLAIPGVIMLLIIITSPWNHVVFYIDDVGIYHRGIFHFTQALCGFGYMATASVLTFIKSRRTQLSEQKKEYRFLGCMALMPFAGGVLQLINYSFVFLWPFTAAAAFLIYINFQTHQISVDSLTSLNNRGSLELYLQKSSEGTSEFCLIIFDIDKFKSINDRHGHIEGDRALKITAQTLNNVFGKSNSFISRFGGDEFAVVTPVTDENEIAEAVAECKAELESLQTEQKLPYTIQISAGWAKCGTEERQSINQLIQCADKRMYEDKRNKPMPSEQHERH